MLKLQKKINFTLALLLDIFRQLLVRLSRLVYHFFIFPQYLTTTKLHGIQFSFLARVFLWLGELIFLVLDVVGIPEWYEIGSAWLKYNSRPMKPSEVALAKSIFGPQLPYWRIRLDEKAYLGPRQYHFFYVSFCVINSWRKMPAAILVHELVHVWQFQRYGSPYIIRALLAQTTKAGYDYGQKKGLEAAISTGQGLAFFNYEQQASIIEDFFRLRADGLARWGSANALDYLETYRYFHDALQGPQA